MRGNRFLNRFLGDGRSLFDDRSLFDRRQGPFISDRMVDNRDETAILGHESNSLITESDASHHAIPTNLFTLRGGESPRIETCRFVSENLSSQLINTLG